MITSSGAICDVCGSYILPLDPDERVNTFTVRQISGMELHCHNRCKEVVIKCNGDWKQLTPGPLRKVYENSHRMLEEESSRQLPE